MDPVLVNGWALLGILIGLGLIVVNRPGGSGFDARDWQAGLPIRHRAERVKTSMKLLPRFKHGVLVGAVLIAISLGAIFFFS